MSTLPPKAHFIGLLVAQSNQVHDLFFQCHISKDNWIESEHKTFLDCYYRYRVDDDNVYFELLLRLPKYLDNYQQTLYLALKEHDEQLKQEIGTSIFWDDNDMLCQISYSIDLDDKETWDDVIQSIVKLAWLFHVELDNVLTTQYPEELVYENNQDFNENLDSQYDNTLFGIEISPSQMLFELHREEYYQQLIEDKIHRRHELEEEVINLYPRPIADHYHKVKHGYEDATQRLLALRDVWESLIYVVSTVVLGETECEQLPLSGAVKESNLRSDSLYDRIQIVRDIFQRADERNITLSSRHLISDVALKQLESLNRDVRNEISHTSAKSNNQMKQLFDSTIDIVLSILQDCSRLSEVMMFRYRNQQGLNLTCETLIGFSQPRKLPIITISTQQQTDYMKYFSSDQLLTQYDGKIFSLCPFIHFEENGDALVITILKGKERYERVGQSSQIINKALYDNNILPFRLLIALP